MTTATRILPVPRSDALVVAGPRGSGVTAVTRALAGRLPRWTVIEAADLAPGVSPLVVVFVVSAAAALTESDCEPLHAVATHTDVVVGVVSKIDAHRQWRQMLAADRDILTDQARRYRRVPWVGAAAAPTHGGPQLDELIAELTRQLCRADLRRRNRLRSWYQQLRTELDGIVEEARVDPMRQLRRQRAHLVADQRLAKSQQVITLRAGIAQARLHGAQVIRSRCAALRNELAEDIADMTRCREVDFPVTVYARLNAVAAHIEHDIAEQLADLARQLDLAGYLPGTQARSPLPALDPDKPVWASRRLETQLMTVLGAGFGLGVALTLSRFLTRLTPGPAAVAAVGGAVVALAAAGWVVRVRALLRDRAVLDHWVAEVTAGARSAVQEHAGMALLAAESALTAALAERHETEVADVTAQLADLDRRLRVCAAVRARAVVCGDRRLVQLRRALGWVCAELGESSARA